MKIKCPYWLWCKWEEKGKFPRWAKILWPKAHWCDEMDFLLIIDNTMDCYCGIVDRSQDFEQYFDDEDLL